MIQGGDPTATGRGGASIYGKTFKDEIHEDLKHTGTKSRTYRYKKITLEVFRNHF